MMILKVMIKILFGDPKGQALTASNLTNEFSIVYCIFPKTIMKRGSRGFFHEYGKKAGVLVKRVHGGEVWYHAPEDYLEWKSFLDVQTDNQVLK